MTPEKLKSIIEDIQHDRRMLAVKDILLNLETEIKEACKLEVIKRQRKEDGRIMILARDIPSILAAIDSAEVGV